MGRISLLVESGNICWSSETLKIWSILLTTEVPLEWGIDIGKELTGLFSDDGLWHIWSMLTLVLLLVVFVLFFLNGRLISSLFTAIRSDWQTTDEESANTLLLAFCLCRRGNTWHSDMLTCNKISDNNKITWSLCEWILKNRSKFTHACMHSHMHT